MVPLISAQHYTQQDKKPIAALLCRVAISISGDARSFVDPAVHRSFRRYVVEAIENNGCQVDVFAYAMLEDDVDILLASVHLFLLFKLLHISAAGAGASASLCLALLVLVFLVVAVVVLILFLRTFNSATCPDLYGRAPPASMLVHGTTQ